MPVFLFLRFCFCVMLLGILSLISLSHKWRKCFIWYEATCQHLFSGLICSLFPFLFSSSAGSFSVNSNNTSVLSVPTILFHECQNPGSDECPRDSTYHLRSASIWMSNFLVNWTCGEGLLKYKNWLCLCGWIIWLEKGGTFFTTLVDNYALTMQRTSCFRLSLLNNDLISCYPIQCSNHTLRPH